MARQLIKAARAAGDTSVPSADNISHNIYRWERGAVAPAERYRLYYCGAFAIPFGQFGSSPPQARTGRQDLPGMVDPSRESSPPLLTVDCYRPTAPPDAGASAIRREVLMAAHEGSEHAERAEQRGIGEGHPGVVPCGRDEPVRPVHDRRDVRDLQGDAAGQEPDLEALDRRQWPRDAAELYLLAGCLSALMAAAATNLGFPQDAEELTRFRAGPTPRSSIIVR